MIQLDGFLPHPLQSLGINERTQVFGPPCTFVDGQRYLVVAPSGKGKSTLLHTLYGLRKDYDGQVEIEGREARSYTPDDWAAFRQQQCAIVFQDLRLFPELSALENIQLKARLTGHKSDEQIRDLAAQLGVDHLLPQTAATLSYGQQQRMAIVRALCQPFRWILLDEPTSHLDEANTEAAFALIQQECAAQQAGMILVSLGETFGLDFAGSLEL